MSCQRRNADHLRHDDDGLTLSEEEQYRQEQNDYDAEEDE